MTDRATDLRVVRKENGGLVILLEPTSGDRTLRLEFTPRKARLLQTLINEALS